MKRYKSIIHKLLECTSKPMQMARRVLFFCWFTGVSLLPATTLQAQSSKADSLKSLMDNYETVSIENTSEAKSILSLAEKVAGTDPVALAKIYYNMIFLNWYRLGNIEVALQVYRDHQALLDSSEFSEQLQYDVSMIQNDKKYAPLILRLWDRTVSEPAYIPNIKIRLTVPNAEFFNRLSKDQQQRLNFIASREFINSKRFHFVRDDQTREYVIQLAYFPVSEEDGTYWILFDDQYRYSFHFSMYQKDTIQIKWGGDAWVLREWVPDDEVRLIIPNNYKLSLNSEPVNLANSSNGDIIADLPLDLKRSNKLLVELDPVSGRSIQYYTWRSLTFLTVLTIVGATFYMGVN